MVLNKEEIQKRRAELEQNRVQALANANAFAGAVQDCDHWLSILEQEEVKPVEG